MIDIHSHLLYGVDDGSHSFESSVRMLERAAKDGIRSIVATPHFSGHIRETAKQAHDKLAPEAEKRNIELHFGCEYDFSHLNAHDELITLGGTSNYILVDLCLSFLSPITVNLLHEWQHKGYNIILVHPERLFDRDNMSRLQELADAKMYFQLNAGSFCGNYGHRARRFARLLARRGLCHFIASDAHSAGSYAGQIPECRKYIERKFGSDMAKVLFEENPRRMLEGRRLVKIW